MAVNSFSFQRVILGLIRVAPGNQHVTRDNLFSNVDAYYSLCYAGTRGNIRSYYDNCSAGQRLNTRIAQFRLKPRTEVQVNWYLLNTDGLIAVIGKFILCVTLCKANFLMKIIIKLP